MPIRLVKATGGNRLAAKLGSTGPFPGWGGTGLSAPTAILRWPSQRREKRFNVKSPAVWAYDFGDIKMIRFSKSLTWAKILIETRGPKIEWKPYHIYKEPLKYLLPEHFLSNINLNVAIIQLPRCRQQMFLRRIIFQGAKGKGYFWPAFSITRSHWNSNLATLEQAVMTDASNAHPEDLQPSGRTDRSNYALLQFEMCFIAFSCSEGWHSVQYPAGGNTEPWDYPICQSSWIKFNIIINPTLNIRSLLK